MIDMTLNKKIQKFIDSLDIEDIPKERKQVLEPLIGYIQKRVDEKKNSIRLNFICTHNSRRSHLAQIWAKVVAYYFEFPYIDCYSGGTEATALYSSVIKTLEDVGFNTQILAGTDNPVYSIRYAENELPIIGFSKTITHSFNPQQFAAIMTCSQADEECPFVPGATQRIAIAYDDPKSYDGTPLETEKYNERSMQVATEMKYIFSKIKPNRY